MGGPRGSACMQPRPPHTLLALLFHRRCCVVLCPLLDVGQKLRGRGERV